MIKKYLKSLGKNIRNTRKSKGISQERLAELIGKSRNYIGMVERSEINTPTETIMEIAVALNVHPKTFFEY